MSPKAQANFKKRIRVALATQDMSVSALAKKIGRRRDTVSVAIHSNRFPIVKRQIEEALK